MSQFNGRQENAAEARRAGREADINKLNSAVGWIPKFQIHEGVKKILEETF